MTNGGVQSKKVGADGLERACATVAPSGETTRYRAVLRAADVERGGIE